jgi:hypothetical protein
VQGRAQAQERSAAGLAIAPPHSLARELGLARELDPALAIDQEQELDLALATDLVLATDQASGTDRGSCPPIGPTALVTVTTEATPSGITRRICRTMAAVFGEIILITPGGT